MYAHKNLRPSDVYSQLMCLFRVSISFLFSLSPRGYRGVTSDLRDAMRGTKKGYGIVSMPLVPGVLVGTSSIKGPTTGTYWRGSRGS